MKLTEQDLHIIKEFIDYYEMVKDLYNKYNEIREQSKRVEAQGKCGNIIYLTSKFDYENMHNELSYVEELYSEMYSGNLELYFESQEKSEATEEIEPPTKIYNPNKPPLDKDSYGKETNTQTITQIYKVLKRLYNSYNKNDNSIYFLCSQTKEKDIMLYKKFKHAICEYNNSNIERISILETYKNASQKTK